VSYSLGKFQCLSRNYCKQLFLSYHPSCSHNPLNSCSISTQVQVIASVRIFITLRRLALNPLMEWLVIAYNRLAASMDVQWRARVTIPVRFTTDQKRRDT